jgi:NO-binding membrane sensor protein with MHYT domain
MNQRMSTTHNYWLAALSYGIAVPASRTAIALVERVPSVSNGEPGWRGE